MRRFTNQHRTFLLIALGVIIPLLLAPSAVLAVAGYSTKILPACAKSGDCTVDDFLRLFVNLANWGLAGLAGITVFFFVWGGFTLVISEGSAEKVTAGKQSILGAVIGMLIVLASYTLVNTLVVVFTNTGDGTIFAGSDWERYWTQQEEKNSCVNSSDYDEDCSTSTADLRAGCGDAHGDRVATLQSQLQNLGCLSGEVDGCFGIQTERAVVRFQEANGLPVDGSADPATIAVLGGHPASCQVDDTAEDPQGGTCYPDELSFPCLSLISKQQCTELGGGYSETDTDGSANINRCTLGCCSVTVGISGVFCYAPVNKIWCDGFGVNYLWNANDANCSTTDPVGPLTACPEVELPFSRQ